MLLLNSHRVWLSAVAFALASLAQIVPADELPPRGRGQAVAEKFHIVGYLPEYRIAGIRPEVGRHVTDLVYFSAEAQADGGLKLPRASAEHIEKLQKIKRDHKVALLLCVGGWERSAGFAMLSASAAGREKFAAAAVKFCRDSDFDGVDIDWEHPGSPQEYAAFAALLTALKKAFAPHRLQLTIAVAGWQELPAEAISAVDRVHLMAYDAEGRHSTYEFAESDVARMLKQNIPAGKLCLGVPFYGRGIADRSRVLTYAEIVSKHKPDPAVDDLDGIYFNGVKTIERKTKFARKAKLAGVMAWEIGQDTVDDSSLLKAIDRAAK